MTAAARLEALVGPAIAGAILDALREELADGRDAAARTAGFCSVAEAADMLGVSRRQVYRLVESGGLPSRRVGERIVVPRSALT